MSLMGLIELRGLRELMGLMAYGVHRAWDLGIRASRAYRAH